MNEAAIGPFSSFGSFRTNPEDRRVADETLLQRIHGKPSLAMDRILRALGLNQILFPL
ncbi:hypothetical protein [Paenibacillus sp. USDA918EY]|uniref:hypothetical protein n=1 Tax=Paenibacillus sp. USDA918EY TaxID=2689575 RepID=UPI001F4319E7|nr:hypothetical protein [Paenibacillus sp. USDA918EY]